ncbi:MAG: phosphoribosyl-ATP diphosphatase [Pseudomonadota bacterium]
MHDTLKALQATLAARRSETAERSYTRSLLEGGPTKCAKKFGEEAVELVIAGVGEDDAALTNEAADVVYHLLVLLEARGVAFDDVLGELERRMGTSGHDEKASRGRRS